MMLSPRSGKFGLVHEHRDETGGTREGSRSEVPGFQSFEPRTSDRACLARRTRRALERPADLFSILLMFQFVSHSAQQMRHAKRLLEGLPCPEKLRNIQDILFLSCA
jgi:hypothetical protein